jgi:hypothetical protein
MFAANKQQTTKLWMWRMEYLHHEQRPLYLVLNCSSPCVFNRLTAFLTTSVWARPLFRPKAIAVFWSNLCGNKPSVHHVPGFPSYRYVPQRASNFMFKSYQSNKTEHKIYPTTAHSNQLHIVALHSL